MGMLMLNDHFAIWLDVIYVEKNAYGEIDGFQAKIQVQALGRSPAFFYWQNLLITTSMHCYIFQSNPIHLSKISTQIKKKKSLSPLSFIMILDEAD